VKILKASDFSLEGAKNRLLNLEILDFPPDMNHQEKEHYLASIIEFDRVQMVRSNPNLSNSS
jgi:hypothetical protein